MNDKLQEFFTAVRNMRGYQKQYFLSHGRDKVALAKSKEYEVLVDRQLGELDGTAPALFES